MTKAEFLHLSAGEQRWVLLRCLKYALMVILPGVMRGPGTQEIMRGQWTDQDRAETLDGLMEEADMAAQEEVITP